MKSETRNGAGRNNTREGFGEGNQEYQTKDSGNCTVSKIRQKCNSARYIGIVEPGISRYLPQGKAWRQRFGSKFSWDKTWPDLALIIRVLFKLHLKSHTTCTISHTSKNQSIWISQPIDYYDSMLVSWRVILQTDMWPVSGTKGESSLESAKYRLPSTSGGWFSCSEVSIRALSYDPTSPSKLSSRFSVQRLAGQAPLCLDTLPLLTVFHSSAL